MLTVYYDKNCPLCDKYVTYQEMLQEFGRVNLINMRELSPQDKHFFDIHNVDVNSGVVVHGMLDGESFVLQGADVLHFFAQYNKPVTNAWYWLDVVVKQKMLAKVIYPVLFMVRKVLLKILKIDSRIV